MNAPFPNSYWLEPERILCGEYPRDFEETSEHEKMSQILKSGVRVFLDLTEEGEKKPYRHIAEEKAIQLGFSTSDLEFHRHSIPDVSVPGKRAVMEAILRTVRLTRQRGQVIYIHCWGGKGRTGTVAGCALNDLFQLEGEKALTELGKRWQACAKSLHSDSPETDEQRGYVREWNPVESTFRSKVRAAIVGAAVGDALGVPVEFEGRAARNQDPISDMRAFGTHNQPAGTWSDDTSMILATINGFLVKGAYDPGAVMEEFAAWLGEAKHTPYGVVFDVGNATREAIGRFRMGTPAKGCGGTDEWSNGNGSLMRILPVALAFGNDPDLIEKASEMSALTHAHERSRMACAFYCLVVSELLHDSSLRNATAFAWEVMDERWTFSPEERNRFLQWNPTTLFAREEKDVHGTGHVIDTLEASLWMCEKRDSFSEAVLGAVNLGDDTDTTGCVTGGLAGIIFGLDDIPAEWRNTLTGETEICDLADKFSDSFVAQSGPSASATRY